MLCANILPFGNQCYFLCALPTFSHSLCGPPLFGNPALAQWQSPLFYLLDSPRFRRAAFDSIFSLPIVSITLATSAPSLLGVYDG